MGDLSKYCRKQYEFVRESRRILLSYCKAVSAREFVNENSSFGRGGSIRNLLVHIANTYEFWIGMHALKRNIVFTAYSSKTTIEEIHKLFDDVDSIMFKFIALLEKPDHKIIEYEIDGIKNVAEAFKLFSHVVTHEFHHKGQILSLSRHLGYIPVDTDIMR
jgi:uncharacterized damage-inducible protein DinB